jgi:hypothetical protein
MRTLQQLLQDEVPVRTSFLSSIRYAVAVEVNERCFGIEDFSPTQQHLSLDNAIDEVLTVFASLNDEERTALTVDARTVLKKIFNLTAVA